MSHAKVTTNPTTTPDNILSEDKLVYEEKIYLNNEIQINNGINTVINLEIPDDILFKRIDGRLTHPSSGRSYNIFFNPPKKPMTDDFTGEPLVKRPDDNSDALKSRLDAFHKQTQPVINYYSSQGKVATINANQPLATVGGGVKKAMEECV